MVLFLIAMTTQIGFGFETIDINVGSNCEDAIKKLRGIGFFELKDADESIVIREGIGEIAFSIKREEIGLVYVLTVTFSKKDMTVVGMFVKPSPASGMQPKGYQIEIPITRFTYNKDRSVLVVIAPPATATDEEIEKSKKDSIDAIMKKAQNPPHQPKSVSKK